MCLSPLTINIANKSKYYHPYFSQLVSADVPCGYCDECVNEVRNDIFVRCKSHYDECIKNGGKVVFLTYTYADDKVPVTSYSLDGADISFDSSIKDCYASNSMFTFNKKHIQKYNNSLRKFYERKGIKKPYTYIVVSEYGSDSRFTQRPHYHGLLYLSKELVNYYTGPHGFNEKQFMNDNKQYWKHGFISKSKHGLFINGLSGIRYLSKYISKTILLSKICRFETFKKFIEDNYNNLEPQDFNYIKSVDSLFKYYMKKCGASLFVLKSKNFGLSAINYLIELKSNGYYDCLYNEFIKGFPYQQNGETKYISYSNYYKRKLFYVTRSDGSYYLNKAGFRYYELYYRDNFDNYVKQIGSLSLKSFLEINQDITEEDTINFSTLISSYNEILKYYLYTKFIRNHSFSQHDKFLIIRMLESDYLSLYKSLYYFIRIKHGYIFNDSSYINVVDDNAQSFIDYQKSHSLVFTECYSIPEYDRLYNIINAMMIYDKQVKNADRIEKEYKSKYLRDLNNKNNY